MVENMYKSLNKKKVAKTLFMNIQSVFDYVFWVKLTQQIRKLKIDNDLIS